MFQFRWLLRNMEKKYKRRYFFALFLSALTSALVIVTPILNKELIDRVIIEKDTGPLPFLLAAMAGFQIVRQGLRYFMVIALESSTQNTIFNLRKHLFNVLQFQESSFFDRYRTGDLMTRFTGDLDWCRHCLAFLSYQTIDCVFLFAATLTLFFFTSWKLAVLLFVVTPTLLIITKVYSKRIQGKFLEMREALSDLNTTTQENIAGNKVVTAFTREAYEEERFDKVNEHYKETNLDINKTWLKFFPIIEMLANMMTIITIFGGGFLIIKGELTPGGLSVFTALTWALANPMRNLGNLLNDFQRFFASASKVIEVYYSHPLIKDKPEAIKREHMKGHIVFKDVDFAFGHNQILRDINFEIKPGQTLAIMGPTGSGKTTLINLLARFYDVDEGEILVDGDNVKSWRLDDLRGRMGVANQDVFLFSATVDTNIAFGNLNLSFDEVTEFAKFAAAHNFIEKLPNGYETVIGERGVGLSGGQRQRVALARALAVEPSILILDDTTSAVDLETEKYIQAQFKHLPFHCTKIIIAQRVSSVKDADMILVVENGTISEKGTHSDLIENRGYYWETFALQNDIPLDANYHVITKGGEA